LHKALKENSTFYSYDRDADSSLIKLYIDTCLFYRKRLDPAPEPVLICCLNKSIHLIMVSGSISIMHLISIVYLGGLHTGQG